MVVQPVREQRWFAGTQLAAKLGWQRVQVAQEKRGPAPAPVVARVELTVERAADESPVRLRGAVALHGVTTWFVADLTTGRVVLRDARGTTWSAGIDTMPLAAVLPATTGGTQERSVEQQRLAVGPAWVTWVTASTPRQQSAELVLRLDDAQFLQRVRAVHLAFTWQEQQLAELVQAWCGGKRPV